MLYVKSVSKKHHVKIKDWLKSKGIYVDAVYARKEHTDDIEEDYAQIYNDFNIVNLKNIAKSIIFINSIDIDSPTLDSNVELENLITNKDQGSVISGLPYTTNCHSELDT